MTVRKAVDQVVAEGMLHRVLGRGTYVSEVRTDVPQYRVERFVPRGGRRPGVCPFPLLGDPQQLQATVPGSGDPHPGRHTAG